jgi:isochorismate synthase EntC
MIFSLEAFLDSGMIISISSDRILLCWGESKKIAYEEICHENPAFYLSDFFLQTRDPWLQYTYWKEMNVQECMEFLGSCVLSRVHWSLLDPEVFKGAFQQLKEDLDRGFLQKRVLYTFASSASEMTKQRLASVLYRLLGSLHLSNGYMYGYWDASHGVLGISPELLFSHDQSEPEKLYTMALAGTFHSSQMRNELQGNEKEKYEHALVVQGISESMKKIGRVRTGSLQVVHYPKLTHFYTPIEVSLFGSFCFESCVDMLHPTPALGGFPKREGKHWLEKYEKKVPRGLYGMPFGVKYLGISLCVVGIRNVQWKTGAGMHIASGCGIIRQSAYEKEWKEIHMKIRAIRDQLFL